LCFNRISKEVSNDWSDISEKAPRPSVGHRIGTEGGEMTGKRMFGIVILAMYGIAYIGAIIHTVYKEGPAILWYLAAAYVFVGLLYLAIYLIYWGEKK
jgi:hypothetical protein